MKRIALVLGTAIVSLWVWTAGPSVATESVTPAAKQPAHAVRPLGLTAFKTFTSNAGLGSTIKISTDGNVYSFASPKTVDHINAGDDVEGYVLCYTAPNTTNTIDAYDVAESASGFLASTDKASPLSVTRKTSDGDLQLTQTYAYNALGRSLRITMSLKNLTAKSIADVSLRRQVDFDVDAGGSAGSNDFDNLWGATSPSVFAYNDSRGVPVILGPGDHGMMMRILAEKGLETESPGATVTFNDTDCSPLLDQTPIGPKDDGASYTVIGKTMPAGATWTETIEYDAF